MQPKVSVIIPCYGVEKYLDRCMNSIVNQTLKDIEIILVDDGSPDRVPEMCDEWAARDIRIKVVHKQNGGLGYARNSGLDIATGDYIVFVDSDDFIETSMLDRLLSEIQQSNSDAVFCGVKNEQRDGSWKAKKEVKEKTVFEGREKVHSMLLDLIASKPKAKAERPFRMSVWHSMYRHSIIMKNNIRFMSERIVASEDLPFQCQFFAHSHKIIYLPECYYYYCLNASSLTSTFKKEKFEGVLRMRDEIIKLYPGDKDIEQRINRHVIGISRNYLRNLFICHVPHKLTIIREMLGNPFWNEVEKYFYPSYLPLYQAVTYWLQIHNQPLLLLFWIRFSLLLKPSN